MRSGNYYSTVHDSQIEESISVSPINRRTDKENIINILYGTFSVTDKNKIISFKGDGMELQIIMLNETCQTQKEEYLMPFLKHLSCVCGGVCICMYVCMHVCFCIHVCMYACVFVFMYVCTYACVYVYLYMYVYGLSFIYALSVCLSVCLSLSWVRWIFDPGSKLGGEKSEWGGGYILLVHDWL